MTRSREAPVPPLDGSSRPALPTGNVTFLFTDVQGSSALWEQDAEAMNAALEEHDRRIREAVADYHGYVFTTAGDSFSVAFSGPADAVWAAVAMQRSLAAPTEGPEIRVRVGLHTGTSTERDGDYFGPVLNRCARLMSAGHGGQILLSETTAGLLRDQLESELDFTDLGTHELKDLSRPEHIYQISHPSLQTTFPALRTPNVVETKLPVQLTSFVGRQKELHEIAGLLGSARLVTLAGPGGGGKTRLAIEAASAAADTYPGGIGFIELAPIADPHLVADTAAAVLDVVPGPDVPIETAIAAKIGDRDVLLVLDHCEHVGSAVAVLLHELLRRAPGLRVLLTSQSPLGIAGEVVYRVPTLSLPSKDAPLGDAVTSDAVSLFAERARLTKPSFTVRVDNLDAVVSLCHRLDGSPLALELAAARIRVLAPEQIEERLDQRFRLLAGASQSEDRHQSLQATIDWSHDLLSEPEKALFRRCAVFVGAFSLPAVEAIAADDEIDEFAILDLFSALVDKSLVVVDESNNETRFRLLESMRDYALAQLGESPDVSSSQLRHLAYFADYAEALLHQLRSGELVAALAGMRAERDNLRAALDYGLSNDQHELAARVIAGIGHLWYTSGAFREGIDWCARLFALEPDLSPTVLASVLHSYGSLLGSWAEPEAGAAMLERQVGLRRELDEPLRLAAGLNNLGSIWTEIGRRDEGEAALREAVEIYQSQGVSPALPIIGLGWSNLHSGQYEKANEYYHEALVEARSANDTYDLALTTTAIGQCALQLGRVDEARSFLEEGHSRFSELGVVPGRQDAELHLALVARAEGHGPEAASRLLAALEEPDSHWTASGKFWVVQVATSIIEDRVLAAQLIGFITAYYQSANESQPSFVYDDLAVTANQLVIEHGADSDAHNQVGQRYSHAEVIAATRTALAVIIDV